MVLGRYYPGQTCSAAGALEIVGERWSLLILRNAFFQGHKRFSDFERALGIAPNILAKRLEGFVADGLMVIEEGPGGAREYRLTPKGMDLKPVVIALNNWGDRWLCQGPVDYIHRGCEGMVRQTLTCDACGNDVAVEDVGVRIRAK
jgi:DNA-binding HxlR family transcriptional regulator